MSSFFVLKNMKLYSAFFKKEWFPDFKTKLVINISLCWLEKIYRTTRKQIHQQTARKLSSQIVILYFELFNLWENGLKSSVKRFLLRPKNCDHIYRWTPSGRSDLQEILFPHLSQEYHCRYAQLDWQHQKSHSIINLIPGSVPIPHQLRLTSKLSKIKI